MTRLQTVKQWRARRAHAAHAVADQARRMIVSEKKDQCSVVNVEGRWNDSKLLRHH